jgi:hypothetical protein
VNFASKEWKQLKVRGRKELDELIENMLKTDLEVRYDSKQALTQLNKWLAQINIEQEEELKKKPKQRLAFLKEEEEKKKIVRGALMNLMHFQAKTKAKVSVYQYFASELLSNQERLVITQAFKLLD